MEFFSIYDQGFARVAACTVPLALVDPAANAATTLAVARECHAEGVAIAVFPELGLTGYSLEDLVLQDPLLDAVESALGDIVDASAELLPVQSLELNGNEVALPAATSRVPELEQLGYAGQLRALVADLAAGSTPTMSAAFGREVLQVVLAAYWSAGKHGEEVALPFAGPRDLTPLQLWRQG